MIHRGKYYISFKRGYEESRKDITISVDKLFDRDTLRLTLSDDEDPTFLCRIQLTRCDYEELKKQQGLLIDYDNFPSQVVRLLQQCTANNMFLILHHVNSGHYNFEIVEHNEFKRLVHLSLRTGPACDDDIKQHMAETINELKKSLSTVKCSAANNESMWSDKCLKFESRLKELTMILAKMEEDKLTRESEYQEALKLEKDKLAQEKAHLLKTADLSEKNILANYQENLTKKEKQIDELRCSCSQLRDKLCHLECQLSEKNQTSNMLEKEVQKSHIEAATLRAKNATLERDIIDRDKQILQLNTRCASVDKILNENSNTIKELNEQIHALKMDKNSLERRLDLSESLSNKNNEALQSTTDQLLKANQIISKQNQDLIQMKDKLVCRTAIALEQEKVIERNVQEIQELNSKVSSAREDLDKMKKEFDSLKEKYELSEIALKDKDETIRNNNLVIQWLHKKMEDNGNNMTDRHKTGLVNVASSTPYFLNKNNSELHESTIDESPKALGVPKGLDPKYLQPASDENGKKKEAQGSATSKSKGKENKRFELPRVDYREKKSARGSTYRATPVSAYFP
ncbi:unnamed protein product [Leptidea sinapis]|uniref:Spindle assembly abnormal protein 6 N-terminal domain-containing protein n=2 Tax=Leptidea sinapis TaxID=189913 RepID=A0A5E4PVZ7_9NEOP|nr:unnamed protein product [Leptidea sinapis]